MRKTIGTQDLIETVLGVNYIGLEGAEHIDIAIRDLFTDIIHIAKKHKIPFTKLVERLNDAKEVFDEEEKR